MKLEDYMGYDASSGVVFWKSPTNKRHKPGDEAGHERAQDGYIRIFFKKKAYLAHRVAWYLYYGKWPEKQLDHINRLRNDNRIENLREVSGRENAQNQISFNHGAFKKKNKWQASIWVDGKKKALGSYGSFDEAKLAYEIAALELTSVP